MSANPSYFLPQEVIRRKRNGEKLSNDEISHFINNFSQGSISEAQAAAFAMAVYFNGMDFEEAHNLTLSMRDSGKTLNWDLPGPVIDKHSTGGVGDKVSIMLAPIIAACGCFVPMISGRGLGHTGGTLDKLAAIPGYDVQPGVEEFQRIVGKVGCAIIGQTNDMAPADKKLYAIRDITATVESIPLITASILSKKFASGLRYLCMDIKTGSGAFMKETDKAQDLANSIESVCRKEGIPADCVLTDMNSVLGLTAGHNLELIESFDYLSGHYREPRLHKVVMRLAGSMLHITGIANSTKDGSMMAEAKLNDGSAAEKFEQMVAALGGPSNILNGRGGILDAAELSMPVFADRDGYLNYDCREIGLALINLGGGRKIQSDLIDPRVGFSHCKSVGSLVTQGEPLLVVHASSQTTLDFVTSRLSDILQIQPDKIEFPLFP